MLGTALDTSVLLRFVNVTPRVIRKLRVPGLGQTKVPAVSLTLAQIKSLIEALGVQIPDLILEQRAQAEKIQERQQKILAEAAKKADDWKLKPKFDELQARWLKATDNHEFDLALQILDEAEHVLGQPDPPPEAPRQSEPSRTETPPDVIPLATGQSTATEPPTTVTVGAAEASATPEATNVRGVEEPPAAAQEEQLESAVANDELEAEAFKKDLKQQMLNALAQVKARAAGDLEEQKNLKPQLQFMAYLAGKNCAVIVGLKVGSATRKLLPEIAGVASGGNYLQGECIFEKNAHTFVTDQVAGGLAKKLATALNAETGQKYNVRVRNSDASLILDSLSDVDPEERLTADASEEARETGAGHSQEVGREEEALRKRLESLKPRLESVSQTGGKAAAELRQLLAVFENQLQSANIERATPVLERIERLLDEVQETDARFMRGLAEAVAALGEASHFVDSQLGALEQALKGSEDPELKLIGEAGVKWILGDHGQQLNAAIEEVEKAEFAERAAAVDHALQAVGTYLDHVEASAEIEACDLNDLGVEVAIRRTLGQALDELGQVLVEA